MEVEYRKIINSECENHIASISKYIVPLRAEHFINASRAIGFDNSVVDLAMKDIGLDYKKSEWRKTFYESFWNIAHRSDNKRDIITTLEIYYYN